MKRARQTLPLVLFTAALLSCAGNDDEGTLHYYRVVMDVAGPGGGQVVDAKGLLTCSSRGGISCPSPSLPAGTGTAADESGALKDPRDTQLMPDGCDCTGDWLLTITPSGPGPEYLRFRGGAVYAGGTLGPAVGSLAVGYKAEPCTGALMITKVAEAASAQSGYHFPDIAGGFTVKCASFEVTTGLFYLVPEEAGVVTGQ